MKTIIKIIIVVGSVVVFIIAELQDKQYPIPDWSKFQDSLYNSNDTLQILHPPGTLAMAFYSFTVKNGKITNINLYDHINIYKPSDNILRRALQSQNWKHLGKNTRDKFFRFVFWFGKKNRNAPDTSSNYIQSNFMINPVPDSLDAYFPGGDSLFGKFVSQHIQYPERCLDEKLSGSLLLKFTIETDGSINNITPINEQISYCPQFTEEAIRVLKLSEPWMPAIRNKKFVRAWRTIPFNFRL